MIFWDAVYGIGLGLLIIVITSYAYSWWNGYSISFRTKGVEIDYEQYATKRLFKKKNNTGFEKVDLDDIYLPIRDDKIKSK